MGQECEGFLFLTGQVTRLVGATEEREKNLEEMKSTIFISI